MFLCQLYFFVSWKNSFFNLLFLKLKMLNLLINQLRSFLYINIHDLNGIPYNIELDIIIKWSVCGKTRSVIDFQQPRFQIRVQNDIHAQNLKTHIILQIFRLTRSIVMGQLGLGWTQRFHKHYLDFLDKFFSITAFFFQMTQNRRERSFMAHICTSCFFVKHEFGIVHIYCIVSQMLTNLKLLFYLHLWYFGC